MWKREEWRQLSFLTPVRGVEGQLPEVEGNRLEHCLGHCLRRTLGRPKPRTRATETQEKLPLEVTQFLHCSLASNLPRKEHALHYRVVTTLFHHGQGRL